MCSLRSWPVQNARPVPVSTTQRAAGSSATCRTVVAQQLLGRDVEAVHRLGAVERDGGDAVGRRRAGRGTRRSRSWPAVCPTAAAQAGRRRQRATNRSAAGLSRRPRSAKQRGRGAAGPVGGQQLGGQARGRRRGTCATRARGGSGRRTPSRPRRRGPPGGSSTSSSATAGQRGVRRAQRGEVPGLGRAGVEVGGPGGAAPVAPARSSTASSSGRGEGADPHVGRRARRTHEVRSARSRSRAAREAGGVDEDQLPAAVPAGAGRAGRCGAAASSRRSVARGVAR